MYCKHCAQDKPAEGFYKSSPSKCKDCTKDAVKRHRQANLERVRSYDRMRSSMPHRVAARAKYAKTPAFAESHEAAAQRWAAKHPERRKASHIVGNAVRDGKVIPWPVCAVPECASKPQAHHADYEKPLDVVWLCAKHHRQAHALVADPNDRRKAA
jgi:hypothetical protein